MRHRFVSACVVALALTACRDDTTGPSETSRSPGQTSERSMSGWFHTLWTDSAGRELPERYMLIDDRGRATELLLDAVLVAGRGGIVALNRKRVRVEGEDVAPGRLRVRSIELERFAGPVAAEATAKVGSYPYVTILCKFSDIADESRTVATYTSWTGGTSYPGLDHYWREVSYNQMNVAGSKVVGWYTLPHPMSYYAGDAWDPFSLLSDCVAAADADVDFPHFWGINIQTNGVMRNIATAGGWTGTLDGQTKHYAVNMLPKGSLMGTYAHEEGHNLGLWHSSGPYASTYDSDWDVMSYAYPGWDGDEQGIPQHTISYHKDLLGWIPDVRKLTVEPNTSRTITLERLARPGSGNYLMAQIPMDNAPGQFYTVEARGRVSYDKYLPGAAVVLHQVDPNRQPSGPGFGFDRSAQVVDVDNNGNPNDAGAMWTPGETFTDQANGITVTVDAQTATGFQVTIRRGASSNTWVSRASMARAREAFALTAAGSVLYAVGGRTDDRTILASVEAYSPTSNTWTGKAAVPSRRHDGNGAAVSNGTLYLPGGRNSANTPTRTLYVYNLTTNAWSTKAALPIRSGCGASAFINGLLYVLTGCDGTSGYKGRLHRYSPSSNTWTTRATAPAPHGYPATGVINGKLYVAGGRNAAGIATATLHVYDPVTNTWSTKAAMPTARRGAAGTVINGKLYVVGGSNSSGDVLATTLVYTPATNSWSTKAAMPTARTRLGAAMIGNLLYAVGGRVTTALSKVERYTP